MLLPSDQALQRLKENEERFDKFVNDETGYTSTGNEHVESLIEFLDRKDGELDQAAIGATAAAALAGCEAAQLAAETAETNAETAETNAETAAGQAAASAAAAAQSAIEAAAAGSNLDSSSIALEAAAEIISVDVWTDALSLSLGAGTWLVLADFSFAPYNVGNYEFRIMSGTTTHGAASLRREDTSSYSISLSISAIITLVGTTTVKLQGRFDTAITSGNPRFEAATLGDSVGKCTTLKAIKIHA